MILKIIAIVFIIWIVWAIIAPALAYYFSSKKIKSYSVRDNKFIDNNTKIKKLFP